MAESVIQFFNRYTGEVETEVVYGEQWLRFILFNPFGKITLHTVAKRLHARVSNRVSSMAPTWSSQR